MYEKLLLLKQHLKWSKRRKQKSIVAKGAYNQNSNTIKMLTYAEKLFQIHLSYPQIHMQPASQHIYRI